MENANDTLVPPTPEHANDTLVPPTPEHAHDTVFPDPMRPMDSPIINPFKSFRGYPVYTGPFEVMVPNPLKPDLAPTFEPGVVLNVSNETNHQVDADDSGFKYRKFYITQVVMIPSIILMVLFSLLLIYIIVRHLRAVMKLYMSVIFYALSVLFFASQIITLLLYDLINPEAVPDCDGPNDQVMISFQLAGIIMPAMAVLAVTVVRVVFLTSPFDWRERLTYRKQILGFLTAALVAFLLGFSPLYQLCELEMYSQQCVLVKVWSGRCVACFVLTLGCGLVVPKIAVAAMYCVIYDIIKKARETNRNLSTRSTESTRLSKTESSTTDDKDKSSAKERRIKTERETFPWSIVVVLLLNIVSATPWVVLIGAPELLYKNGKSGTILQLDILYSALLVATALSPLAYLMTTKVVRDTTCKSLTSCFSCVFKCKRDRSTFV